MMTNAAQSLGDLVDDPRPRLARRVRRLGRADEHERDRGDDERDRVDEDRERRADELDQASREARAPDLGDRRARGQLAVSLDEPVPADERGHVRGIRGVEESAEAGGEEHDQVELLDPQRPERVCHRDRQQNCRADQIVPDEERPTAQPVDPRAGDETDDEDPEALHDDEHGELPGARAEHEDRDQWNRGPRHDRAELRDGLPDPEPQEVRVLPERRSSCGHGGRLTADRYVFASGGPAPASSPCARPWSDCAGSACTRAASRHR